MIKIKRKILMLLLCLSMLTLYAAPAYCAEDSGMTSGSVAGTETPDPDQSGEDQKGNPDKEDPEKPVRPCRAPEMPSKGH